MFGREFRFRLVSSVIQELRRYDQPSHSGFFCDDNFAASKPRAREWLEAVIAHGFRVQWSTQVVSRQAGQDGLMQAAARLGPRERRIDHPPARR